MAFTEKRRTTDGDLTVIVKESSQRNRHGASRYEIVIERDGKFVHSEFHEASVWLGHAYGQLLIPEVVKRAREKLELADTKAATQSETPTTSGRFTEEEMRARFERGSLAYRGYTIMAKRDYTDVLAYDRGFYLRDGFVVVKNGVNAMPGASWFKDIDAATQAIDILEVVGEEGFWPAYEYVKRSTEQARQAALAVLAATRPSPGTPA